MAYNLFDFNTVDSSHWNGREVVEDINIIYATTKYAKKHRLYGESVWEMPFDLTTPALVIFHMWKKKIIVDKRFFKFSEVNQKFMILHEKGHIFHGHDSSEILADLHAFERMPKKELKHVKKDIFDSYKKTVKLYKRQSLFSGTFNNEKKEMYNDIENRINFAYDYIKHKNN